MLQGGRIKFSTHNFNMCPILDPARVELKFNVAPNPRHSRLWRHTRAAQLRLTTTMQQPCAPLKTENIDALVFCQTLQPSQTLRLAIGSITRPMGREYRYMLVCSHARIIRRRGASCRSVEHSTCGTNPREIVNNPQFLC